jgi:cytochrome oxidase Cu insertion factor (SCO1/SenC/PrrC family)
MTDSTPTPDQTRRNRGRLQLVFLALLFAAPVLLGTWMYYFSPPAGRTNYGQLIEPQLSLPPLEGQLHDGKPLATKPWLGKWWLVSFHKGVCEDACAKQLYIMRQLRLIQGKDASELERVMFLLDENPLSEKILAAYQGNWFVRDQSQRYAQQFSLAGGQKVDVTQHLFLVDPLGNLMMRYPPDADVEKIKKDLGKLIRLSAGWVRTGNAKDSK